MREEQQLEGFNPSRLRRTRPLSVRAIDPESLRHATRFVLALPTINDDGLQGQLATHPWLEAVSYTHLTLPTTPYV